MIDISMKYGIYATDLPRGKPQRGTVLRCAVCGKGNITLLAREGERFCKKCYAELLRIRLLRKGAEEDGS